MNETFVADEGEQVLRRREGGSALGCAALIVAPGLVGVPLGVVAWAVSGSTDLLALGASLLVNPFVLLPALLLGGTGMQALRGITTRVALEPEHLRIPANGTRGVFVRGIEDGYRYTPSKRMLTVRVPYGRVAEVRRVTDPLEQETLAGRGTHRVLRTKGLGGRTETVRGHVLLGPGAEVGAPALLAEELRTCWVTDPAKAVAITFHQLTLDSTVYPALPPRILGPTLYVSVADPDNLVDSLAGRVQAAPALPADPDAAPLIVPQRPPPPPRPVRASPPVVAAQPKAAGPARPAVTWPTPTTDPVAGRLLQLATGVVWWTVASGGVAAVVVTLTCWAAIEAAGPDLLRDANIFILWFAFLAGVFLSIRGAVLAGGLDLLGIALGLPALWRRLALTGVIVLGPVATAAVGWLTVQPGAATP